MILRAVADGLTTSAISKQLWVSEHTVKFHLTNIYRSSASATAAPPCDALEQHLTLASGRGTRRLGRRAPRPAP